MYLIFYDITPDSLRNKIAQLLQEEGYERLQYSVFVGPYNPKKNKVWTTLQKWMTESAKEKVYCLKISRQSFYNIKTIGTLGQDLDYLAGDQRALIL